MQPKLFAVIRTRGHAWKPSLPMEEQPGWRAHAAFMNGLTDLRFVLFGGPLAGTEHGRLRALLIVDAGSEAEISRRLADDPWEAADQIRTVSIEPWNILTGAERLSSALATGAAT